MFGISDPFEDLSLFRRYRRQALAALSCWDYLPEPGRCVVFYDEVKLFDILRQLPREEMPHYCDASVYTIHRYDQAHNIEYLATLYCYLRQNRSVKAAAGELHLHRNTVNYRVSRLRELFGIDLEDVSVACRMLVSCELLRVFGQEENECR